MKLNDITEGSFGNLISLAAAKIGSKPEDRLVVKSDQRLFGLVQKARRYTFHLFDRRAIPWWKEVFEHFKIPQNMHKEVLAAVRSEYYDRLDHSLFEADLSKIADFLNPRTRQGTAKSAARAATNEKLATAIVGYVSRAAGRIARGARSRPPGPPKPPKPPKPPETPKPQGPRVKRWKRKPDSATIEKAMGVAKMAVKAMSNTRKTYLQQLDSMGFRIDTSTGKPTLRLKL